MTKFIHKQKGASLVEYSIMLALIAMVAFAAVSFFGQAVNNSLTNSAQKMPKN